MGYIRVFKYSLTGYVIGGTFGFLIDRLTTNSYNRYFYRDKRFSLNNSIGFLGLLTGTILGYLHVAKVNDSIKN